MPPVFVPLLSEHKMTFVWNRFFETLLGGLRIFMNSYSHVPVFVYFVQLLVHQTPFFLGAVFTLLVQTQVLTTTLAAIYCCVTATMTAACVQAFSFWIQRDLSEVREARSSSSPPITNKRVPECLLDDDDVVFESCCSRTTVRLLFPNKRFFVNAVIHAMLWGSLTGYGVMYLSPTWLVDRLYGSSGIAYTIFFLGWMSVCISLYSLVVHVPPEPATFHPLDRWEIRSLNRPFYIAVFYSLDLFARTTDTRHDTAVGHIVFVLLPLLFFLNLLPPLDALFLWISEQILVWLGGGSPTASTKRLFYHLTFWGLAVVILYFVQSLVTYTPILTAIFGYILSLDLSEINAFGVVQNTMIINKEATRCDNSDSGHWTRSDAFFFGFIFLVNNATSVALYFGLPTSVNLKICLGYLLLITLIFNIILDNLQSVYFFFGFVRNFFYPPNTREATKFAKKLNTLRHFAIMRYVIASFVAPMFLMIYVFVLDVEFRSKIREMNLTKVSLFHVIASLRAFRWCWQQTDSALLETVIIHFTVLYVTGSLLNDGVTLLLLAAFLHDRLIDFLSKLHVVFSILIPSVTQDKQRRSYSWFLFGLNLFGFPVVFTVLAISSLLSAPMLPLFTLPIFWIGFPRPTHFWPKQENVLCNSSPDFVYYEEIIGKLSKELGRMVARGSLGNIRPGDHFLLRYDDRLAFLSISERGYGYLVAHIKGLELQQTSCHAVEASAIDHLVEEAFERDSLANNGSKCPASVAWGRGHFHVYRPCDVALVETYVETRNVLTGVISSPETLQLISDCFAKCLIWILVHHFRIDYSLIDIEESVYDDSDEVKSVPNEQCTPSRSRPSTADKYAQLPRAPSIYQFLESFSNSISNDPDPWKDDEDPLGVIECPPKSSWTRVATARRISEQSNTLTIPSLPELDEDSANIPGLVAPEPSSEIMSIKSGWPWDPGLTSAKNLANDVPHQKLTSSFGGVDNLMTKNAANFPDDWLKSPVPDDHLKFSEQYFPETWFRFVCVNCSIDEKQAARLAAVYQPLVLSCHVIVNQVRTTGRRMSIGPCNVAKSFNGDLPWSPYSDWLMDNAQLHDFVVKAYRYACKVALDQTLLGEAESDGEFADYLHDYDTSWHLGCDTEQSWVEAIQRRIPNLFSMGYNPVTWTHTSHLLTRRTVPVYVGRLNREMVRSIWSTLSLELLYLTNDDEERYSIQAHSGILRNLTVQGADPPLGYPVYVSQPLLIRSTPSALIDNFGQRNTRVASI